MRGKQRLLIIDEINTDIKDALSCCKEIEKKEKKRMQKKIEIYEKALKRIANIDEEQSVKRRTETDDSHKSAFALGVAQAIAEIALEDGAL